MGELEKLGQKYRIALQLAKDPRFERIPCNCKGCYADDCLVQMATQWRCFIVATCDKELRSRIRKIPGVPAMYITNHKYTVERMPEGVFLVWSHSSITDYTCVLVFYLLILHFSVPIAFGAPR